MVIKVKITDETKEKLYPGGLEAWKKGQEMVDNLIYKRKIEEERRRRAELKRNRLAKQGLVQQKIDIFEDDE